MDPSEIAARDRRKRWDVRSRIEQLEALAARGEEGIPPVIGAKALVREQVRRAESERQPSPSSTSATN